MEDDIVNPFVLQCKECRAIVGDSFHWHSSNESLSLVSLTDVDGERVRIKDKLVTSSKGLDIGSTYSELLCKSCSSLLGRYYRTTLKSLDALRETYSFHVDYIDYYQLGTAQNRDPSALTPPRSQDVLQQQVDKLQQDNLKLKHSIIALTERVIHLESSTEEDDRKRKIKR